MGCAIQDFQQDNGKDTIKTEMTNNKYQHRQTMVAASKESSSDATMTTDKPVEPPRISQLKETHSVLVQILESAPIKPTANIKVEANKHQYGSPEYNTEPKVHQHFRKRIKNIELLAQDKCDDYVVAASEQTDLVCPWKKTKIAKEWREAHGNEIIDEPKKFIITNQERMDDVEQNKLTDMQCDNAIGHDMLMNNNTTATCMDEEDCEVYDHDNELVDDDECSCDCTHHYQQHQLNTIRRCSSDSYDSLQNDSGCDSDCPETISDLCKKFNENCETKPSELNDINNVVHPNEINTEQTKVNNGFFRRSIQQKIQYRPCTKNQQCSILRINRNRCQYCRLKKCIAVGMSRDAVRFGRVPKREKARILAAMQQSTQNRGQQRALATELDDQPRLLAAVLRAHMETCEFTKEKVTQMRQRARDCPSYSMPTLACPLNPAPGLQSEQEFSQRFAHVIRGVIDFAGMIPGFPLLTQDDKFTLLKAGLFDALFVRLICMFDSSINSIICLNGQVMRRDAIQNGANARFLVDSTFNFAERMNSMNLTDAEIGLFCAIVLITPDRPGLRNLELIEKMYAKLKACLQNVIQQNRPGQPDFLNDLLKLMPDLRTLSTLHTEKLVVFRTEHKELLRQQMWSMDDDASKSPGSSSWHCDNNLEDMAKSPMGSVSSTESSETVSSDYSHSLTSSAPLLAATLSGGCPLRHRANSGSSGDDDLVGTAHLQQNGLTITPVVRTVPVTHHIRYRKLDSPTDSGIESGNEKTDLKTASSGSSSCSSPRSSVDDSTDDKQRHIVEDMPVLKRVLQAPPLYDTNSLMDEAYKPHKKFRALRHRECESEAESSSTVSLPPPQSTSVLSHHHHNHHQQQQQHHHHPTSTLTTNNGATVVVVPAPSSTSTKFGGVLTSSTTSTPVPVQQSQSQLHMHLTRPQQPSSLSSTHSVLAKSLMEEPRMTPEQMKRSDIIQNYIMRETQAEQQHHSQQHHYNKIGGPISSPAASSSSSISSAAATSSSNAQVLLVCADTNGPVSGATTSISCPYSGRWQNGSTSVITTTRQQTPSPSGSLAVTPEPRYFQSPHSTSTTPPRPTSTAAQSPRLLELQVDIAENQQPLNLSKKSPTPPPTTIHKVLLEA